MKIKGVTEQGRFRNVQFRYDVKDTDMYKGTEEIESYVKAKLKKAKK